MSADVPETIASDERIVRLRDWLAVSVTAEERAQAESLQRARDLMSLYEDRQDEWVAWMDEHYPVRKSFGRPGDPRSFNRFAGFLVKSGLVDMASRRAYQLRDADDVVRTYLNRVQISPATERSIRPLKRLQKEGYGPQVPKLWEQACERSDPRPPTEKDVHAVIADFGKTWSKTQRRGAVVQLRGKAACQNLHEAWVKAWELDRGGAVAELQKIIDDYKLADTDASDDEALAEVVPIDRTRDVG